MRKFRLAMAQINTTVGDLESNTAKILLFMEKARSLGADLVAFPELAVTGYPPEDLLFKPQFIRDSQRYLQNIVSGSQNIAVVVGFVDGEGGDIYNAAAVAFDGKLIGIYRKIYLPNYGVFDEKRYFKPGNECPIYVVNGVGVGVNICEDIWYSLGPTEVQREAGAELIVNINASPYHAGKQGSREQMLASRAVANKLLVSYTNMVGGQDELVFDGASSVFNQHGKLVARGGQFEEELVVIDLNVGPGSTMGTGGASPKGRNMGSLRSISAASKVHVSEYKDKDHAPSLKQAKRQTLSPIAEIYRALVLGTRDYIHKSGFRKVLVGLSGGIDSSITAAIATEALGKSNVVGVAMPSRYSSEASMGDAKLIARNLGIELMVIPIEPAFTAYLGMLTSQFRGTDTGIAEENVQARVRGNILMALSNKFDWMVLTTGNKSELATGYSTLYGDMAGGFAVIKDVPKTLVYELANYLNTRNGVDVIPKNVINKAPSAELRPNQYDQDSLPPYFILDPILKAYVEEDATYEEILNMGYDAEAIQKAIKLVDRSEYKRRQAPPGIKITPRNFGRDRRMPLVNKYRHF